MDGGKTWADQVLDYFAAGPGIGIDPTLIEAQLKLTPTERLDSRQAAAEALEELRQGLKAGPPPLRTGR